MLVSCFCWLPWRSRDSWLVTEVRSAPLSGAMELPLEAGATVTLAAKPVPDIAAPEAAPELDPLLVPPEAAGVELDPPALLAVPVFAPVPAVAPAAGPAPAPAAPTPPLGVAVPA